MFNARPLDVLELGQRAADYLGMENSNWAYKCWWMTNRWWWDADSRTFVEETRPEMLMMGEWRNSR